MGYRSDEISVLHTRNPSSLALGIDLGLVPPTCLHLATACVQVVELAGAAKAKATRVVTATNKRMNGIPGPGLDKPFCGRAVPHTQS
jgi:hypothetical protein